MPVPFKIYSLNELGQRKNNEDSIMPRNGEALLGTRLFIVCDGVGGNAKGEVASELACCYFSEYFDQYLTSEDLLNDDFINAGREWVMKRFETYIEAHHGAENMSTTLTLAYLKQNSIFVAWCGDSRIHLIRNGDIIFQSQDHSLVNELVKRGDITVEEAATHPHRNVITRSLQAKTPYSAIQTTELFDVEDHDYLLLCTDGLLENITPLVLKEILTSSASADFIMEIQQRCAQKTRDNYSMYLVALHNLQKQPVLKNIAEQSLVRHQPKSRIAVIGILVIAVIIALVYIGYTYNFF